MHIRFTLSSCALTKWFLPYCVSFLMCFSCDSHAIDAFDDQNMLEFLAARDACDVWDDYEFLDIAENDPLLSQTSTFNAAVHSIDNGSPTSVVDQSNSINGNIHSLSNPYKPINKTQSYYEICSESMRNTALCVNHTKNCICSPYCLIPSSAVCIISPCAVHYAASIMPAPCNFVLNFVFLPISFCFSIYGAEICKSSCKKISVY